MTLPSDDDRLVEFLRRHRPIPPTAEPNLENRIMAAIEPPATAVQLPQRERPRRPLWPLPALAASLLLAWVSFAHLRPFRSQEEEFAEVETFLTETWYGATYGDDTIYLALETAESDWVFSVYTPLY